MRIPLILSAFVSCRRGNVAMMFGLLLFVMLAGAGLAIDFQRAATIKSDLQQSADAALIATVRMRMTHPNMTNSELEDHAERFFNANRRSGDEVAYNNFNFQFDADSSTYSLNMNTQIETVLWKVMGRQTLDANVGSQVKLGKPPFLEVVMVLDNTGSMSSNNKLSTLKTAANNLVTSLFSHPEAEVKIGLVPFAQYVNVGEDYQGESWLDGAAPGNSFNGCVGSRDYPANTEDAGYAANPVPEVSGAACPNDLLPLTDSESTITTAINDMQANGWTYIPAGLAWGWRVISPDVPFDEGVAYEDLEDLNGQKSIILMTDGENTRSPDYPTHNNSSVVTANQLTEELCDAIKEKDIVVYTIAFEVNDTTIKTLLEDCGTTPDHYFEAENADQLTAAFESIATALRNIAISK